MGRWGLNVRGGTKVRRLRGRRSARALAALVTASTVALVGLIGAPVEADTIIKGPADVTAARWTPSIATDGKDGSVEQVRQLLPCNGTMYAVGLFSAMSQKGVVYQRNNAFSFSETDGTVTSWDPNVNGVVNSVAFSSDCSTVYLGGKFTAVGGTPVRSLAAVDASTGQVLTTFAPKINNTVNTLVMSNGHLLVGGTFTKVNGATTHPYFVSLNATGTDDGYLSLGLSGNYVYTDQGGRHSATNRTQVYNTALSPDGTKLLVMGTFTSVGGQARRQIFMLDLGTTATVDPWYSPEFNQNCAVPEPFWLRDASWSPDGSTVYIATTGYKPATDKDPYVKTGYYTNEPRGGLCDAAAAFPSGPSSTQLHTWVNYTGCDSLYSTAADANHVYIGGHERRANNPNGCDNILGPGAVDAPGMAGLDPAGGLLNYNPTRARGKGADDMLRTPAGLWIASDNAQNSAQCAGEAKHSGICFLPDDQL